MNFKRKNPLRIWQKAASLLILGFVFQYCQKTESTSAPSAPNKPQKAATQDVPQDVPGGVPFQLEVMDEKRLLKKNPQITLTTGNNKTIKVIAKDDGKGIDNAPRDGIYAAQLILPIKYYVKVLMQSGDLRWELEASHCKAALNETYIFFVLDSEKKAYQGRRDDCVGAGIIRPPKRIIKQRNPDMRPPAVTAPMPPSTGATPPKADPTPASTTKAPPETDPTPASPTKTPPKADPTPASTTKTPPKADPTPASTTKAPPKANPTPASTTKAPPKANLPSVEDNARTELATDPSSGSTEPDDDTPPMDSLWGMSLLGLGIILAGAIALFRSKDDDDDSPSDDTPADE